MSLGGQDFQGVDPVEQAVQALTAETGALFVVAAGNAGEEGRSTVNSPASADAALAVGAVDDARDDDLAEFSSRGPRIGDNAVKPEITAPGVAIKAALPVQDGEEGEEGEPYGEGSGTSMATPHVAGAAAILAQRHPDWDPGRLKAALVGSAKPTSGVGEFAQGAGRVDVARAVRQQVSAAPANLSTYLRYPRKKKPVTREVTYSNDTGKPVTLALSKVSGPFDLGTRRVTVPAHGTATVDVVVDGRGIRPGAYAETLVARSGDNAIRTLLGAYVEPPAHELTVDVTDPHGKPLDTYLLVHSQVEAFHEWLYVENGHVTVRLPDDDYTLTGALETPEPQEPWLHTFAHHPVALRGGDKAVRIDARRGKPISMTLDDPRATNFDYPDFGVVHRRGRADFALVDSWPGEAATVLPARVPGTTFYHYRDWYKKGLKRNQTSPFMYHVADQREGGVPADLSFAAKRRDLAKVTTTYRALHETGEEGESTTGLVLPGHSSFFGIVNPMKLPATIDEYYTPHQDIRYWRASTRLDHFWHSTEVPRSIRPGTHTDAWNAAVLGPALPESCYETWSGPAPACATRDGDTITWLGAQSLVIDGGRKAGPGSRPSAGPRRCGVATRWSRRARCWEAACGHRCRKGARRTRCRCTPSGRGRRPRPRRTSRTGSGQGHTDSLEPLPLLAVRYSPRGLDDHNRASPGSTTTIPMWVERYGDARVTSVTAEASDDGGKTWRKLTVRKQGSDWVTSVRNPSSGSVSLRSTAVDAEGNRVRQTIRDAYLVGS